MTYVFPGESGDIDVMLADSRHAITAGAVTKPCFYDLRGEVGADQGGAAGQVLQIEVATVKAEHFPTIAQDAAVTIAEEGAGSQNYTVLRVLPAGAFTELLLQRAQ